MCLSIAISSFAQQSGQLTETITWELDSEGTLTIRGTGDMPDYNHSTTPWDEFRESIKEVIISEGVTSIGGSAFAFCSNLTSIAIPEGVTNIPQTAFYVCGSLTSVTIPNSVTSIGHAAFAHCYSLTDITIPNRVTSIGTSAFDCCGLTFIDIPNSVTSIGEGAFRVCNGLTSIEVDSENSNYKSENGVLFNKAMTTLVAYPGGKQGEYVIPEGVTSIEESAFTGCGSLTSITIPNSVINIGAYAFQSCSSLTDITIPNSVTSIGHAAFRGTAWYNNQPDGIVYIGSFLCDYKGIMPDNTELDIKNGIVYISPNAFENCIGLTSITIPNSVISIGVAAFVLCSGLTEITIPESVMSIGEGAFSICSGLTSITISDGVTSIGEQAFWGCSGLTSITIPNSVTNIGRYAFYDCNNLTSITIGAGITNISGFHFGDYSKLVNISVDNANPEYSSQDGVLFNKQKTTLIQYPQAKSDDKYIIPNSVTSIGSSAFDGCSLTSITIPNSVTNIGGFGSCNRLTRIDSYIQVPPAANGRTFSGIDKTMCTLYVPAESVDAYKAAGGWKDFNNILAMPFIVDEPTPAGNDGKGSIDFSLEISGDVGITGSFNIQLPEGYTLDEATTFLSETLAELFKLVITLAGDNTWRIEIVANDLRSSHSLPEYTKIMTIGYIVDESVENGSYEIELTDINMQLEDGTSIEEESIIVTTEVDRDLTSISTTAANNIHVYSTQGNIIVENAPVGETIHIYNVSGVLIVAVETQYFASPQKTTIAVSQGAYIVKVGNTTSKVIVP